MAIFTLGEGYHNYHHEFQHDYRNGVKPWQFDPTKWIIWTLSKLSLTRKLRRVPIEKIALAELAEAQHQLEAKLASPGHLDTATASIARRAYHRLQATARQWEQRKAEHLEVTCEMLAEMRNEIRRMRALRLTGLHERLG
jgi:stearoyl-CoA desaturase (Delta-9 desaturase)